MDQGFVNEDGAAKFLNLSPTTLSRWRFMRKGPRVHKFGGAVRYKIADLIEFAAASTTGGE